MFWRGFLGFRWYRNFWRGVSFWSGFWAEKALFCSFSRFLTFLTKMARMFKSAWPLDWMDLTLQNCEYNTWPSLPLLCARGHHWYCWHWRLSLISRVLGSMPLSSRPAIGRKSMWPKITKITKMLKNAQKMPGKCQKMPFFVFFKEKITKNDQKRPFMPARCVQLQ